MWMKGVGWDSDGCLDVAQAKKAVELASDVSRLCVKENLFKDLNILASLNIYFKTTLQQKYRQKVDSMKFTQEADTLFIKHAKKSQELQSDVRYFCKLVLSDSF